MERKINNDLIKWKRDSINKPFFLYGPRQVGKTYSVLEFGNNYYKNIAYFNMDGNNEVKYLLSTEKVLDKLVSKLMALSCETIMEGDTLVVFDNVYDEETMKLLKIFANVNSPYHVVIISSNKIAINKLRIEEFYYRGMNKMDFFEYLINTDKASLIDFIKDSYENDTEMPFHSIALEAYYEYLKTGGFPEVVYAKINDKSSLELEVIKKKILDIYKGEYLFYDNSLRCNEVMNTIFEALKRDNKKFQYGMIRKGARSKEYDECINDLATNGLINRSFRILDVKSPLSSVKDIESFKLYYNDVGLLYTLFNLNNSKFIMDINLKKSLIENDVANTLLSLGYNLYYYQSDGKSEIPFIVQNKMGKIIPIEVVDMNLTKAKAMHLFLKKYNLIDCIKISEDNFGKRKGTKNVPVYALLCLKNL